MDGDLHFRDGDVRGAFVLDPPSEEVPSSWEVGKLYIEVLSEKGWTLMQQWDHIGADYIDYLYCEKQNAEYMFEDVAVVPDNACD